ncbi:MAG: carbon-nitrogen hydrolase family protein [Planctomycetes bacterium]|nr:carbon-nitrogen hydrolase family protein [Planctomycetota bacterium]
MPNIPSKLIVGVWQGYCADGELEQNIARVAQVIDEAGAAGCDFVCFPETFLSGCGSPGLAARCALSLDDPRLLDLAARAEKFKMVALVGMSEKRSNGTHANSVAVLSGGRVIGSYAKTQRTGGDIEDDGFCLDEELPTFEVKGVRFAVQICHDSSFPEIASTYAWKGVQLLFSPHYNWIPKDHMDGHRIRVRNNHIGVAAQFNLVVARSNTVVVNRKGHPEHLGYGDSAIFSSMGTPLAEAGLFTERLVYADVAKWLKPQDDWGFRTNLRPAVVEQWTAAAKAAIKKANS